MRKVKESREVSDVKREEGKVREGEEKERRETCEEEGKEASEYKIEQCIIRCDTI